MSRRQPAAFGGPDAFGPMWADWLRHAWHFMNNRVPVDAIVRLCPETRRQLYSSTARRAPSRPKNCRPVLEGMLQALQTPLPCLAATGSAGHGAQALSLAEWVHWEVYRRGRALGTGKWSQQLIEGGTEEEVLGFLGRTGSFECSRLLTHLLHLRGIPARLGFLFGRPYRGRVGVEAWFDGGWRFLDVKSNVHYARRDGEIASLWDLTTDRLCLARSRGEANREVTPFERRDVQWTGVAEYPITPDPRGYKFAGLSSGGRAQPVPGHALPKFADRLVLHGRPVRTRAQLRPYVGWDRLHGCARQVNRFSANEPKMSEAVVVCADTAEYLYAKFSPTAVRYRAGTRPALEALLRDCVLRGRPRPKSDLDLAFKIFHWVFYQVLQRYLVLWDVWHAPRLRYFGNEEDSASFRNRSDCYCTSRLMASMLQVAGVPARLVYMQDMDTTGGHTALEAFINGRWRFFDVSCHDYALNRAGELASFWEIMSDPYCRAEGLREDPIKVTAVLRLHYLANASIGNFPISDTTAHYALPHGSFWFAPDSDDARRACRFGF